MSKIHLAQPHALPAAQVQGKIDALGKDLQDKYGLTYKWISDTTCELKRTGVSGTLQIEAEQVLVDLDVSFALAAVRGPIEQRLREELYRLLGPASAEVQTPATGDPLSRIEWRVRMAREAAEGASDQIVRRTVIAQLDLAQTEIAALRGAGAEAPGPAADAPLWRIDFYVEEARVRLLVLHTVGLAAYEALLPLDRHPVAVREQVITALAERVTAALFLMIADGANIPSDESPARVAASYLGRAPAPPKGDAASAPPPVVEAPPDPPAAPALSEEERVAQAAAAYKAWRTLANQSQVDSPEELAGASATWTALRDSFPLGTPGAAKLGAATEQIDYEIAEAKRRPAQDPNQLPGAIRVENK